MAGQLLTHVDPVYPAAARSKRVSGPVVLSALIGKEGTVQDLQLISGPASLGEAAMDAVRQWTYKPFLLNGQPRAVQTVVTVTFNLELSPAGKP